MTQSAALVKKHGMGKGLMSKKGASGKKHGIGKGLMTVWRLLNPDGGDLPISVKTSRSTDLTVREKKKRVQRRQPILVSYLI